MLVVCVHVTVKAESIDDFKAATLDNARHSLDEAGIARFDVLQDNEHPERFLLVEAYRTSEAPLRHKETAHYKRWRDAVESMMAEPRQGIKYSALFPDESGW